MKRDLIWLSALTAAAFAILAGLGCWQLQRLTWKQDLISRIEARTRAEPVSLDTALETWKKTRDVEYFRVRVSGRFIHGAERHLFSVVDGASGWRVVTPMETAAGDIVLTVRGFVPDKLKEPVSRGAGQVEGQQTYIGLARVPGTQGWFTPDNDADRNAWYWRDLEGMARGIQSVEAGKRLVPFFVELEANYVPGGWPKGGVTRVSLPDKHLQYAITWFGLAGALLAVYAFYLFGRLRRQRTFT